MQADVKIVTDMMAKESVLGNRSLFCHVLLATTLKDCYDRYSIRRPVPG
jgi:hypothetical protein